MKTSDLIAQLAADTPPVSGANPRRRMIIPVLIGSALAIAIVYGWLGVLALDQNRQLPAWWLKFSYAAIMAAVGFALSILLSRPASASPRLLLGFGALLVSAMAGLGVWTMISATPDARMATVMGHSWLVCPWNILIVSAPIYAGALFALRGMAPSRPAMAGAAAGLFAGGLGAALYALHCPELSPAFVAIWYTAGIALSTGLGALVGSRALRW